MQSWSKQKLRVVAIGVFMLIVAWFILGIYLHIQVAQSRAKVEQARIEASRRQEFMRRGAQYKQELQQRSGPSRVRNVLDGR